MDKRPYETPQVQTLGTIRELTQDGHAIEKCAGSADLTLPRVPDTCDATGTFP